MGGCDDVLLERTTVLDDSNDRSFGVWFVWVRIEDVKLAPRSLKIS